MTIISYFGAFMIMFTIGVSDTGIVMRPDERNTAIMNYDQTIFSLRTIIQIVLFQAAWFLSILGAAYGLVWLGPAFVAVLLLMRLKTSRRPVCDVCFFTACASIGFLIDTSFIATGIFTPAVFFFPPPLGQPWNIFLWINFALVMDTALSWFRNRPLFQSLLGAFGGPAAHIGAMFFGAVTLGKPIVMTLVVLTVVWAAVIPVLFAILESVDRRYSLG
jgi:hypothetical protein